MSSSHGIKVNADAKLMPVKKTNASFEVFSREESTKISNAMVMQINELAGQLFEMHNNIFRMICFKPRRVYKHLAREY